MISRITKRMQVGGEGGFTLIELLVVIIIIAILAAIAIPMYLSQRQKGWQANVKSDLRNAAVADESYYTGSDPTSYALVGNEAALYAEGYNKSANIVFSIARGNANGYCLEAHHTANTTDVWKLDSAAGEPQDEAVAGPC